MTVLPARTLGELRSCLKGQAPWPAPPPPPATDDDELDEPLDLGEVRGLAWARRGLEAAAAGGHHLLLSGPPGVGKTMIARRLATVLPGLTDDEALEVTQIHSAAGRAPGRPVARAAGRGRRTTPRPSPRSSAAGARGRVPAR